MAETIPKEYLAETNEEKAQAKEYSKRVNSLIKELQKLFKPKGFQEKLVWNLMMGQFRTELQAYIESVKPSKTKEIIETMIKRLKWVLAE